MKYYSFIFFTTLCFLSSCSHQEMRPSELIEWVENEENGLRQSKNFEHFGFEVIYKPTDYVIAMEGRTDNLSESKYQKLKTEIGDLQYVDIKIKTIGGEGNALSGNMETEEDYYSRLDYFVMYANQDISLIQGADTLAPMLYHFERNYGLAPYNTLLLGFDKNNNSDSKTILIDDQIMGIGRIKFDFDNSDIKATPQLKRS